MSDSLNKHQDAKPIPQITSLSTAYPMQFESESPRHDDPRRTPPQPPRDPRRHDAGE